MISTTGLAEIVLMVRDVEESRRFYEETLGLKVISSNFGGPVFLRAGEDQPGVPQQIVLVPRSADAPDLPANRAEQSFHHLGLMLPRGSVQDARERLQAEGFEVRT